MISGGGDRPAIDAVSDRSAIRAVMDPLAV
jgi:hypothetical protein